MGLAYDTAQGTCTFPHAKLTKAAHLLHEPQFGHGTDRLNFQKVQRLRGNATYWHVVVP